MSSLNNVPAELLDGVQDCIDKRVKLTIKHLVNYETKKGQENRILVLSPYRCYIFPTKIPIKIESSFHYLEIIEIESKQPNYLVIGTKTRKHNFTSLEAETDEMNHIITHIGTSLKTIFPAWPLKHLINKIEVQPSDRLKLMYDLMNGIEVKEIGPCGGFSHMYACMCDLHDVTYKEEVAWDVDTIYLAQDSKELCLRDFDHLKEGDLVPIVSALLYNTWFTSLNADNVKLGPEVCTEIIHVLQKNSVIEALLMNNTGISLDFVRRLAQVSLANTQLHKMDLSNNTIDDMGVEHLFVSQKNCSKGYTYLDLSRNKITTKGLNKMAELMSKSAHISTTLQTLNLSYLSSGKMDDLSSLYSFLALPNTISHLNLSGTDIELDKLMEPFVRGCNQHIVHLHLAKTNFSLKKSKEVVVQDSFKRFFSSAVCLQHVNLSGAKLPPDSIKELLLGIGSNSNLKGVYLDISNIELSPPGAQYLYKYLPSVRNVSRLNISGIGFSDQELIDILNCIGENKYIKHLAIGRVFSRIRKNWKAVLDELVQLIQDEDSVIESLSLADSKLKSNMNAIINVLGSNKSLTEIDISGNMMEDPGARSLSKALQINDKLKTIIWDRNNTSFVGFEDIASALEKNYTLKKMPIPIHDASEAVKQSERAEEALQKIEALLQRNHSPHKYSSDQAYRLQQGFLISSTQQMVDRLIVQNQDTIYALQKLDASQTHNNYIESTKSLIKDANNSKTLLQRLHDVATEAQGNNNPVSQRLNEISTELKTVLNTHLKATMHHMLDDAKKLYSTILSDEAFLADIQKGCDEKSTLPKDFTSNILEAVDTEIFNKLSELNLAVAAHVSDKLIEAVLDRLSFCHKTLTNQLNEKQQDITQQSKNVEANVVKIRQKSTDSLVPSQSNRTSMQQRMVRPHSELDGTDSKDSFSKVTSVAANRFDDVVKHPILDCPGKNRPKIPRKTRPTARPTELLQSTSSDNLQVDDGLEGFYPDATQVVNVFEDNSTRKNSSSSTFESKKKSGGIFGFGNKDNKKSSFSGLFKKTPKPGITSSPSKELNTVSDVQEDDSLKNEHGDASVSGEMECSSVSTSSSDSTSFTYNDNSQMIAVNRSNSILSNNSAKQNNGNVNDNINIPTTEKKPLQVPQNVALKKQPKKETPIAPDEDKELKLSSKVAEVIAKVNIPIDTEEKDNTEKEQHSNTVEKSEDTVAEKEQHSNTVEKSEDTVAEKKQQKDNNTDEDNDEVFKRKETAAGSSQGNNMIKAPTVIGGVGLSGSLLTEMKEKQEKRQSPLFPSKTGKSDKEFSKAEVGTPLFHLKPVAEVKRKGSSSKDGDVVETVADNANRKGSISKDREFDKNHKLPANKAQIKEFPKSESALMKMNKKLEATEVVPSEIGQNLTTIKAKVLPKDNVHKPELPTDKLAITLKSGLNRSSPNAQVKPNILSTKPVQVDKKSHSSSENEQDVQVLSLHTSEVMDPGIVSDTDTHLAAHSNSAGETASIDAIGGSLQQNKSELEGRPDLKQNKDSDIKPDIIEDHQATTKISDMDNASTGIDNKDVESAATEVNDKNVH